MNKKAVIVFLLAMILTSGVILLGIRLYQGGVFEGLFSSKETSASITIDTSYEAMATSETVPEIIEFASEADARSYVLTYAANNGIDATLYPERIYNLLYKNPNSLSFVLDYPVYVNSGASVPAATTVSSEVEVTTDIVDDSSEATSEIIDETTSAETAVTSIVSLEGEVSTARITPLWTWDSRWGYTTYGNGSFCFTGSAPTCVSIVAMYLLRNPAFSPQWIAEYSMNNGYCDENCDGSHESSLVADGGFGLGINVTQIPASDLDRIKRNLDVPNPIICDVGDHYIILLSYEEDNFTVIDPTSEYDTNRTWSWAELSPRLEGLWVYRVL